MILSEYLKSANGLRNVNTARLNYAIQLLTSRIGHSPKPFRNSDLLIEDPLFVFRGNPKHKLHDVFGYKNNSIPHSVDILCLGNSQVHSLDDPPDDTWPGILGQKYNYNIYNASMGAFSTIQYYLSFIELLFLNPKLVITTIYTGNNLFNTMKTIRLVPDHIKKQFNTSLIYLKVGFKNPDIRFLKETVSQVHIEKFMTAVKMKIEGFVFARVHNVVYYLLPLIRYNYINLNNPYIQAGFDLSMQAILHIFNLAKKRNIQMILMIMPTKEYLVYKRLKVYNDVSASSTHEIEQQGAMEDTVIQLFIHYCKQNSIQTINCTEFLLPHIHEPIYKLLSMDGHPSHLGKVLISDSLQDCLDNIII